MEFWQPNNAISHQLSVSPNSVQQHKQNHATFSHRSYSTHVKLLYDNCQQFPYYLFRTSIQITIKQQQQSCLAPATCTATSIAVITTA